MTFFALKPVIILTNPFNRKTTITNHTKHVGFLNEREANLPQVPKPRSWKQNKEKMTYNYLSETSIFNTNPSLFKRLIIWNRGIYSIDR
ncbi:hypothetical protein DMA11_10170 [Marinilabiliaceae bacterium JC017]|nr:hypothetical protein DMA11_10170 [Marinilabiliaceae bacterium JC017]